ncbi:MAG: hypothetical protein DCC57_01315 [Chloroflexi bacterium]|nr:MAG: hypothetical protein DCC57_01315 [Chloroflexota bacterium]
MLRLFALVAVVALVYFAQYIFDHGSLAGFYPGWLLTLFPLLRRTTRWLPADLLVFAQWITAVGLLGFGLLSPMWTGETNRLYRRMRGVAGEGSARPWRWAAWALMLAALLLVAFGWGMAARAAQPVWPKGIWLGAVLSLLGAAYAYSQAAPGVVYARRYIAYVRPASAGHGLAVLLVILALLYTFELRDLPARVDPITAGTGLQVRQVLQSDGSPLWQGEPPLPRLGLALLMTWVTHDPLLGVRLAGVVAGLLMVAAVWLLATELFRRAPQQGIFGEVIEDDGRWLALMAAASAAVGVAVYHFARMPVYVESVALGSLAIWALLRGLRTDRPWLLALSGLGLGWTWYYGPQALSFTLAALAAWIGVALLERGWLTGKVVSAREAVVRQTPEGENPVQVQHGAGWGGAGLWLVGLLVFVAPLLSLWAGGPEITPGPLAWHAAGTAPLGLQTWAAGAPSLAQLGANLRLALLGLNQLPDQSGLASASTHLLPSLLAPLWVLAVGALLLNMDSLMGWVIVTWLGCALLAAALTAPVHPFWPALLPILPAVGLALAFVMDRLRVLLMETLGTWTLQATVYLALGVVIAAGMLSWITFYQTAHDGDLASAVGRAADLSEARTSGSAAGVQLVVVNGQEHLGRVLEQPAVLLLAGEEAAARALQIQAGAWPDSLPTPARMLVAPADVSYIPLLQSLYPGGVWQVQRDLSANPVLYIHDLPAEP